MGRREGEDRGGSQPPHAMRRRHSDPPPRPLQALQMRTVAAESSVLRALREMARMRTTAQPENAHVQTVEGVGRRARQREIHAPKERSHFEEAE